MRKGVTDIVLMYKLLSHGLSRPRRLIQHMRWEHIRVLRKAIREESPLQILKNFDNLLNNRAVQEVQPIAADYTRHTILYVIPNLPEYDTSSGGKRATEQLALLCKDHTVIVFTAGDRPMKYVDHLQNLGCHVVHHSYEENLRFELERVDSIIFAWYYMVHQHAILFKHFPYSKKIIDTVDVHWVRENRSIGIVPNITEASYKEHKASEIEAYKHGDVIWAVTENDKQAILAELPDKDVRIVSNIHDFKPVPEDIAADNYNLLFIGNYNHYPNLSAVRTAAREIFPLIKKRYPTTRLIIAGADAPEEVKMLANLDGVDYIGFVPLEELEALYRSSRVALAPLLTGAGIKGKICEAVAQGVVVATTPIGNEGINLVHQKEAFIQDSHFLLAQDIMELFRGVYAEKPLLEAAQKKVMPLVLGDLALRHMKDSLKSEVSICIVTWNRLDLLQKCVESILSNTIYPDYRILIYSNGCDDGTQEYAKKLETKHPNIEAILSDKNDVFVIPNNKMMELHPSNDVVLINNDVTVTKNWLVELKKAAYSDKAIGISGSKILYPDGKLQEFGSELYPDGTGRNIGKNDDPNKSEYNALKRVGYVSGCAMYIKRSTIETIGVFDEKFHPCYCEDSDFSYRAWKEGIQTVVTPKSVVYHLEGATAGTDESKGHKHYQTVNFSYFLKKHGDQLPRIADYIKQLNS